MISHYPVRLTLSWPIPLSLGEEWEEFVSGGGWNTNMQFLSFPPFAHASSPSLPPSRFVSWRDKEEGSWFIQAFVDTMFEKADKDHFMDILTEVNRQVAFNFQTKGRNKQIPAPVTTLTHKLYFAPTGDK